MRMYIKKDTHHADADSGHIELVKALLDVIRVCECIHVVLQHSAQLVGPLGHRDQSGTVALVDGLDHLRKHRFFLGVLRHGAGADLCEGGLVPAADVANIRCEKTER